MDKIVRFYNRRKLFDSIMVEMDEKWPGAAPLYLSKGIYDEFESKKILADMGIMTVQEYLVSSEDEVVNYAEKIGYPVVLKGIIPQLIHKTEQGLVKTNLYTKEQVKYAYLELADKVFGKGKVLIQKQIEIGYELIAGLTRDENFGPVVILGFGGILADILEDKIFRAAPFSLQEAYLYTYDLKNQNILDGYRKYSKIDRMELAKILKILGDIGSNSPEIQSMDLNPLVVNSNGIFCVDATIVVG